ncbi:hypothetical protein PVAP13_1NG413938 [Panicum virgatum]|uniref:Uncharacterized protein n=1 Tax=Panicum virgatum TaxID=38727 RepID=A0A8T0X5Q5_PANVG|nr:hypothetical protein PVAP13_1NG413938 [Panicum virgatum]
MYTRYLAPARLDPAAAAALPNYGCTDRGAASRRPRRHQPFPLSPSRGVQLSQWRWQPSTRRRCRASWQRCGAAGKAGSDVVLQGEADGNTAVQGKRERWSMPTRLRCSRGSRPCRSPMNSSGASMVREPRSGGCGGRSPHRGCSSGARPPAGCSWSSAPSRRSGHRQQAAAARGARRSEPSCGRAPHNHSPASSRRCLHPPPSGRPWCPLPSPSPPP